MCAGEELRVLAVLISFTKVQGLQNGLFSFIQKHFNVYKISFIANVSGIKITANGKIYQAIVESSFKDFN